MDFSWATVGKYAKFIGIAAVFMIIVGFLIWSYSTLFSMILIVGGVVIGLAAYFAAPREVDYYAPPPKIGKSSSI